MCVCVGVKLAGLEQEGEREGEKKNEKNCISETHGLNYLHV